MKTLKQWKAYYRDKYPDQSDKRITELAQAAFDKQQNQIPAGGQTGITFGGTEASSDKARGVLIGFGLTDANGDALIIPPARLPSYMQSLLLKDPKTYRQVQTAVFQASGRKYSSADDLGKWLQTVAQNLQQAARQDTTLSNVNIEAVVNAGIVNRASNPIFAKAGAENLPTRQIYAKTKAEVETDINSQAEKVLGRSITPDDMQQQWYKDLRKGIRALYNEGILTTTERVRNPKTGKIENVVKQVPQFSAEQVTEQITTALEEADPMSLERKKNLEFANWAFQKMGGRG